MIYMKGRRLEGFKDRLAKPVCYSPWVSRQDHALILSIVSRGVWPSSTAALDKHAEDTFSEESQTWIFETDENCHDALA